MLTVPLKIRLVFTVVILNAAFWASAAYAQPSDEQRPFLILIDPGHGGTNLGAPSIEEHVYEKHVTLALAKTLQQDLVAKGFAVRLTRSDDRYLSLRQRGRAANAMSADLFISLHGNATESHSHSGYETYILTPDAIDVDSRALRHNSGRRRQGVSAKDSALLDDIERSTSQMAAARIATAIQAKLRELRGKSGDRGVRQDAMDVLFGATMPAVLIEVGFVDHPIEGKELLNARIRAQISSAIAEAVTQYVFES